MCTFPATYDALRCGWIRACTISFQSRLNIQCLGSMGLGAMVVGLTWYNGRNGYFEQDCPTLAICYDNGRMQIMRNESDDSKYLGIIV